MLTVLTTDECLALLGSVPMGRVGISINALPLVLPVNFVVVDGDVVFRTVMGTKFHAASEGAVLAFEADDWEPSGNSGWSVAIQGKSAVVTDPIELERLAGLTTESWALDGAADRFVRIRSVTTTGRRFQR